MDNVISFQNPNGKFILCGINTNGLIEFQDEDRKIILIVTQATLEAVMQSLGLRTPLFNDAIKPYLDERFNRLENRIEKLLGA